MVVGRSRSLLPVLAVPVLILFIPIFDTLLVIMLRKLAGRAASQGGRDHTSHRLVALGLSERKAVWMLYGFATVSGLLALWVRDKELDVSLALIIAFTLSLTFLGIHLGGVKVYTAEEVRAAAEKPLVSFLIDVSYKRRVFEVLLDVVLIALSYYTAYVLVFGPIEGHLERAWFFQTIPVLVSVKIAVFLASGVYRGLWRYVSLDSLVTFTKAVALSSLASILAIVFCFRFEGYSRAVFALDGLILLFLLSGSRMAFRVFRQLLPTSAPAGGRRVLIYGAGDAGELLLREIRNNPARSCTPIGFIDDDRRKTGRVIHGLRVLGASHAFRMILSAYRIEEVLISTHHLTDERVAELAVDCRNAGITLRRMRLQMECLVDPAPAGSNGHDQDDGSASGFSSWMTTALTRASRPRVRGGSGTGRHGSIRVGRSGASGGDRGRVEMMPEPQFQHQQRPELIGMVADARLMFVDQGGDGRGAEEVPAERDGVEQDRSQFRLQWAAKPAIERHAEAHFRAIAERGGSRSANASLRTTFERPPRSRTFRRAGSATASSTTRWSRKGLRHSRLCAMLARSTLTRMSPGRYVNMSATVARVTGSRLSAASKARRRSAAGSAPSGSRRPAAASAASHEEE